MDGLLRRAADRQATRDLAEAGRRGLAGYFFALLLVVIVVDGALVPLRGVVDGTLVWHARNLLVVLPFHLWILRRSRLFVEAIDPPDAERA